MLCNGFEQTDRSRGHPLALAGDAKAFLGGRLDRDIRDRDAEGIR